ncbi:MAG: flippase-like domain-containing protein [Flavobacteriales bacterium]|nr:flippase-like domain-containing protein [Flavobacteriales bacterium]
MTTANNGRLSIRSGWKIWIPVLIGIAVAVYMIMSAIREEKFIADPNGNYEWVDNNQNGLVDFSDPSEFKLSTCCGSYSRQRFTDAIGKLDWGWMSVLGIFMAFVMMMVRDLAYMWRIRLLTEKRLTWRQSFRVIMIWEFASAVTPGVVGGAAVAMFILNKEKIEMGRATALVMITALLDELFYILVVPILLLIAGTAALFPIDLTKSIFGLDLHVVGLFWIAFSFIALITFLLFFAVFVSPSSFGSFLIFICRLPFLNRFSHRAERLKQDIIVTSAELKNKAFSFWVKAFMATAISWTARFLVINFLLFSIVPFTDHLVIFARQLSMWVILLVSPTPGGSGIAEFVFSGFLSDFVPFGLAGLFAVLWRLISYYPYLLIGAIVLPRWLGGDDENRE